MTLWGLEASNTRAEKPALRLGEPDPPFEHCDLPRLRQFDGHGKTNDTATDDRRANVQAQTLHTDRPAIPRRIRGAHPARDTACGRPCERVTACAMRSSAVPVSLDLAAARQHSLR